jgi:hypothetical protein
MIHIRLSPTGAALSLFVFFVSGAANAQTGGPQNGSTEQLRLSEILAADGSGYTIDGPLPFSAGTSSTPSFTCSRGAAPSSAGSGRRWCQGAGLFGESGGITRRYATMAQSTEVTDNGADFASPLGILDSPSGLPHVANNTALSAMTHAAYPAVVRDGYATAGDAPPLTFYSHGSACSLNAGAGDGGSQVPTSDGGCWKANFATTGLDVRQFGAKCDGSTNDTTPAQAAETYLESLNGGALVFPARSCVVSLIIANNNVTVEGVSRSSEGAGGAKLIAPSRNAAVISVGKVSAFTLKDLTITSASQQISGALVSLNRTALANIDNVFIYHGYNNMIWTNVGGPSRITGGEWNDLATTRGWSPGQRPFPEEGTTIT